MRKYLLYWFMFCINHKRTQVTGYYGQTMGIILLIHRQYANGKLTDIKMNYSCVCEWQYRLICDKLRPMAIVKRSVGDSAEDIIT